MNMLLAVGLGGSIGAILRVLLMRLLPVEVCHQFPIQILVVNIVGCFAMGGLTEFMSSYWLVSPTMRAFLTTGVLGGFTTFSSFSLEYALLTEKSLYISALLYAFLTFSLTISAFFIGAKIVSRI